LMGICAAVVAVEQASASRGRNRMIFFMIVLLNRIWNAPSQFRKTGFQYEAIGIVGDFSAC